MRTSLCQYIETMKLEIAQKIKSLKKGQSFTVSSESERQRASKDYHTLRRAGVVTFALTTKAVGDGTFIVAAI